MRRLISGLLASAISLVVLLCALEFGFRVLGIGEDTIAQAHPWVGWTHIPSRRAEIPSEDKTLARRTPFDAGNRRVGNTCRAGKPSLPAPEIPPEHETVAIKSSRPA